MKYVAFGNNIVMGTNDFKQYSLITRCNMKVSDVTSYGDINMSTLKTDDSNISNILNDSTLYVTPTKLDNVNKVLISNFPFRESSIKLDDHYDAFTGERLFICKNNKLVGNILSKMFA